MFFPNTLKNLGTSSYKPHIPHWCIRLRDWWKSTYFFRTPKMQAEVMCLQSLLGPGLLYTCTVSLCTLSVFFLLFYSCPVVRLPFSILVLPALRSDQCPRLSELKIAKWLESSINYFLIPWTLISLILLPHAGYMMHAMALQLLRLPNDSYKPATSQL